MKLCLLFFARILVLVTLKSSLSLSSSPPSSSLLSSQEVRSVLEAKEQNTDFTIGMCILSLGRYDINDNKQINRTEFQYVIHHVCDGNNYTAIANFRDSDTSSLVSLNQTIWDDVFVEAACTCQSFNSSSNSKSTNDTKENDAEGKCCDPNNVNKNVVYRPGKYSSNYTYTICRYLQTVFQQYDCIPKATDIPTTAPMSNNIITTPTMSPTVPSMLPIPMLRMPKINTNAGTNDTKLNSGILIVLILLSFIIGTIILYMSKKTMMNKTDRKAKFSSENAMEINNDGGNDNYNDDDENNDNIDAESPTSSNDASLCCWWHPTRRQQQRELLHDSSNIIAVEAIAKGSVIRKNPKSRPQQQPTVVTNLDNENTAYESYSNDDDEYSSSHQYYHDKDIDANEIMDGMAIAEGQRRRSSSNKKRKKKDDDILVLVVAATPPENSDVDTKNQEDDNSHNTSKTSGVTGTTITTGDIDDPKWTSQGRSNPSKPYLNLVTLSTATQTALSSSAPPTNQSYRYNDADTEPYNDLMYAGSNQYFDNVSTSNTNNNHLNMVLLQQQQQIQAILNESDDDDDDDDDHNNNNDVYVDDVDDSSSDTSSGSSTSASADSSKSSTTLDNINNSSADTILNSPHRSTLLQRVDENDEDDIDPDTNTTSSSSSSSAGIVSNSSSMVALLSDPLLPPSLYTHNANNSSVLDHGENVIPTKRPTTITTTVQTTQCENDQATPTKVTNIENENGNTSHNITSKTLISSSITPNRQTSVVITPNTNDSDRSNDSDDETDEDDDINILLQQYHQKPLSQGSVTNSDAANDDVQYQKLSYDDTGSVISTQSSTPTIATNTRSLGAGNTPINISPSHEDFNVTLQWNTNPTTTTTALNMLSAKEQVNDSHSNSDESTQVLLQEQRSDEAVDNHEDFDDATTVVISNQNQASSLFRHIFKSPNKIENFRKHSTDESKNDNPKHTRPTSSSSPPPVQTVITKSKNVVTPSKARTANSETTTTDVV